MEFKFTKQEEDFKAEVEHFLTTELPADRNQPRFQTKAGRKRLADYCLAQRIWR